VTDKELILVEAFHYSYTMEMST